MGHAQPKGVLKITNPHCRGLRQLGSHQTPTAALHPPPSQDGASRTPGCRISRSLDGIQTGHVEKFLASNVVSPRLRFLCHYGSFHFYFFPFLSSIFEQVKVKPRRAESSANKGRRGESQGELCMPGPTLLQREETWAQPVDKGEQTSWLHLGQGIRKLGTAPGFLSANRVWLEAGIKPSAEECGSFPAAESKLAPNPPLKTRLT